MAIHCGGASWPFIDRGVGSSWLFINYGCGHRWPFVEVGDELPRLFVVLGTIVVGGAVNIGECSLLSVDSHKTHLLLYCAPSPSFQLLPLS